MLLFHSSLLGLYQLLAPPVWAYQPLLAFTDNHTNTEGTGSYDAFYGIKAMCSWMERINQTQRSLLVIFVSDVLLSGAEFELSVNVLVYVSLDLCTSVRKVSLSTSYCMCQQQSCMSLGILGVSLVCPHGVWCLCSNHQQVCSIVSACSVLYWWEKDAQPYTATGICVS